MDSGAVLRRYQDEQAYQRHILCTAEFWKIPFVPIVKINRFSVSFTNRPDHHDIAEIYVETP
jgi:hypothetical protein